MKGAHKRPEEFAALDVLIENDFPAFLQKSFESQNQGLEAPERLYPHVTIAWPFMPRKDVNNSVLEKLEGALQSSAAFDFWLTHTAMFRNEAGEIEVCVLLAKPAHRFLNLSKKVFDAFPDVKEKQDKWPRKPHCAIVRLQLSTRLDERAEELAGKLTHLLPIRCKADRVHLMLCDSRGWKSGYAFTLNQ